MLSVRHIGHWSKTPVIAAPELKFKVSIRDVARQTGVHRDKARRVAKRIGLMSEFRKASLSPEQAQRLADAIAVEIGATDRSPSAA